MPKDIITTKYGFQTTVARSMHMKRIRGKNTKPEITFRKALWAQGVRYRKNYSKIPGKPDVAIVKYKIAIFIDGTFWHGYNWKEKKRRIRSNKEYWIKKIEGNIARDQLINTQLNKIGWIVLRFWDFEVKKDLSLCINKTMTALKARQKILLA
jgi:DNA mismatch endonuclease (patch repair protein)